MVGFFSESLGFALLVRRQMFLLPLLPFLQFLRGALQIEVRPFFLLLGDQSLALADAIELVEFGLVTDCHLVVALRRDP